MLKPLLFILLLVILIAIALNSNLFQNDAPTIVTEDITLQKDLNNLIEKNSTLVVDSLVETNSTIKSDSNLTNELKSLIKEASILFQTNSDSEVFRIYDEIIKKSQESNDIEVLKIFAQACMGKAFLHSIYPQNDIDSTIEDYDMIINRFEKSNSYDLLKIYMDAKLQQAQFLSKDEILESYDELINKFENDQENRFTKEIEELKFSKSFALMGVNDEEAMEVLDDIISKYQKEGSTNLPETVQFSILNNIELSIITNNDDGKYIDLANKYLANSSDTKPLLDMLNIIKNAQDLEQDEALTQWYEEHSDYYFPNWNFEELRKWARDMEDKERKERINRYLDSFEKQKYNREQYGNIVYENSSDEGQNNENNPYATTSNSEEDTPIYYEEDPYINDIYQYPSYDDAQLIPYADPYANTTEPYVVDE